MAEPTTFNGGNDILRGGPASKYGTEQDVADLPIWRGQGHVISCWKLSWRERLQALWRGRVWLRVASSNHPPLAVDALDPFK